MAPLREYPLAHARAKALLRARATREDDPPPQPARTAQRHPRRTKTTKTVLAVVLAGVLLLMRYGDFGCICS
jgi:hypothetical protein